MDCVGPRIPRFSERTKEPQDWCERRCSQSVWRPEQHTQYLARVCMHIQPSPLEVHEEKVHNNVYASSRDEKTRYGPQSISAAVERGARNVMERRSQYVGRRGKIIFPNESRGDHDGARLSRIRIFLRAGGPRILCMR